MSASVREIKEWLSTLDDDDYVGIDDGGLALESENTGNVFEIGGIPNPADQEEREEPQ